ncbi:MAG TPA: DUF3846 domain-containing protein [Clostridiales bacterium]|nr:DUF3846 domain-containing protein [Clostridiales bacterium]
MNITIYKINLLRDKNRVQFVEYEHLENLQGTSDIDCKLYVKIYEGNLPDTVKNLKDICKKFNASPPKGFAPHSINVSDIIEIKNTDKIEPGFYYCNKYGFKKVAFTYIAPNEKTMKVVILEPGKAARTTEISTAPEGINNIIKEGYQLSQVLDDDVVLIYNAEGHIRHLPFNRFFFTKNGKLVAIVAGTALICGITNNGFGSLSDEEVKYYLSKFKHPIYSF